MQLISRPNVLPPAGEFARQTVEASRDAQGGAQFHVIRRNGSVVGFEPGKISVAMTKAFLAINGGQGAASARVRELVDAEVRRVNQLFARVENIRKFVILEKELDHDDGELTATQKVRRSIIGKKFAREIELIYGGGTA